MSGYTYYNDIEHFPCEVLRKNIKRGLLPEGYVDERDIREVHATDLVGYQHIHLFAGIGAFPLGFQRAGVPEHLRIITGGFPCQDISNAGKRAGLEGEHSGLWFEMFRLIQETIDSGMGPDYICIENVAAITGRGLSRVLADLAEAGFDAEWQCLRASDFGAPHQRERIFIVAYPQRITCQQRSRLNMQRRWQNKAQQIRMGSCDVVDASSQRRQQITRGTSSDEGTHERWSSPYYHQPASHDQNSQSMAHTAEQGLPQWGNAQLPTHGQESTGGVVAQSERCGIVADTSGSGQQELDTATIAEGTRHPSWRTRSPGSQGQSQSYVGRVFAWLPTKLDRYYWPAGPGEQQYSWEPPRTVTGKQPHRIARLKALGNSIVPQITEYIGHCIIAHEQINIEMEDGGAA